MPQYAGFWVRLIAYVIDGFVVDALSILLGVVLGLVVSGYHRDDTVAFLGMGLASVLGLLYWAVLESCPTQATLGKMAVGIQVTDLEGRRISFGRALGRNLAKMLSALLLSFGFLMAAFTARKQALHDILAGTLVIRRGSAPPVDEGPRLMSGPAPEHATPRTFDDGR